MAPTRLKARTAQAANPKAHRALWRLAHACGIKPAYTDNEQHRQRATPEAMIATLRAFGIPIERPEDAEALLHERHAAKARQIIPTVFVIWDDRSATVPLQLPEDDGKSFTLECELRIDDGHVHRWTVDRGHLPERASRDGHTYWLALPTPLPHGYHVLNLHISGRREPVRAWVFAAPSTAYTVPYERTTGVFVPLYALHGQTSWGTGDLGDLRQLGRFITECGGTVIGTLPLLALFLDEPCESSPYSPVSRLFFNELYLDVKGLPEFEASNDARTIHTDPSFQQTLSEINATDRVDFRRAMALKRQALEAMSRACWSDATQCRRQLEEACSHDELLQQYARFRAVGEKHGANWRSWPSDLRERVLMGTLAPDNAEPDAVRYHLYVQWQLRRQLQDVGRAMRGEGGGLYLDLPVGAHPDGFDAFRFERSFAEGAAVGAPPDDFFTGGQNWGFSPLHPERMREDGHHCFMHAIRRHLEMAGRLRIDHVMGLHRLFWVPQGFPPTEGVYARYPAEELYAVLCIESHRHHSIIVGENLGTVPDVVNRTMKRRGIAPLFVGQFGWADQEHAVFQRVPRGAVASLNTHDTPPFAAFWNGRDIDERLRDGLLDEAKAQTEREGRARLREHVLRALEVRRMNVDSDDPAAICEALMVLLAESDASVTLVSLEDFWAETEPQNRPGTTSETNWSRKAARSLEAITSENALRHALRRIVSARH